MSSHAKLSPSSAHRWMLCPGSVAAEEELFDPEAPQESSVYADEGTAAHFLAEQCLNGGACVDADEFIGREIGITEDGEAQWFVEGLCYRRIFHVDQEMADHIGTYLRAVYDYADGGELMVEQRMSIEHMTGEADAKGTADAVVLLDNELQVHDLKYGRGEEIDAEENQQLLMYASAAAEAFGILYEFDRVRVVIHQPRRNHLSEWDFDRARLALFEEEAIKAALATGDPDAPRVPGDKQCRWCKAKAHCQALADFVTRTVDDDFVDITELPELHPVPPENIGSELLAGCYEVLPLIRQWCEAIEGRMRDEVANGLQPKYKLVAGRRGNRAWTSADEVEELLKSMRLKKEEMYDFKLISPTTAEKLLKKDSPRRWAKLEDKITQPEGKAVIAPVSDKRPAVGVTADDFDNLDN